GRRASADDPVGGRGVAAVLDELAGGGQIRPGIRQRARIRAREAQLVELLAPPVAHADALVADQARSPGLHLLSPHSGEYVTRWARIQPGMAKTPLADGRGLPSSTISPSPSPSRHSRLCSTSPVPRPT